MRVRLTIVAAVAIFAVAFGVVAPPERCPAASVADIRRAATAAAGWFERNQRDDGSWLYQYDADTGKEVDDYNVVRHAGAVMGLYQAAGAGIPGALATGDRGLQWALGRLVERGATTALDTDGQLPTGASALLAAALVHRRVVTGETTYDPLLDRLGRFLVAQIEPSGAVAAYGDPAPGAEKWSKYYTGETFWALALLARTFPDESWRQPATRIGHYLATRRDKAEDHWPPVPDHWAAYGMAELATAPGAPPPDHATITYARRQAELFGFQVRSVAQRFGPWGRVVRGSWVPRGGGYGVVGEALGQLWRLSATTPKLADIRGPIAERDRCIVGLAIDAQTVGGGDGRARGAWLRGGETRMDDQQHAMSALLHAIPIATSKPPSRSPSPSRWLWAVALVALADPASLRNLRNWVIGRVQTGQSPRTVVVVAVVLGVVVAAALLAAVSGPVLDAFDVSRPSARLAAAAVMAAVAAVHLVRRPPIALGLAAAPVVALAAGADVGTLVVTVAAAVVVAVAGVLPSGPSLRWVTRVTAVVLVACAILLALDAVLDV